MSRAVRLGVFGAAAIVVAAVLVHGVSGLPRFGHYHGVYGTVLARVTVAQRRATDVITAITFDYRGLDTMGEEFILFAAAVGLVVLLREQRGERRQENGEARRDAPDAETGAPDVSPALAVTGRWLVGPILVLGVYIVSHGQLTPGGGFQGGVVLATAIILLATAVGRVGMNRIRPAGPAEVLEAVGAGGYVALGLAGLIAGARFLSNFLPLGTKGSLLSSGTIASLSVIVGLEVGGALTLIVAEFADQRGLSAPR